MQTKLTRTRPPVGARRPATLALLMLAPALLLVSAATQADAQTRPAPSAAATTKPRAASGATVAQRILAAEDERRWDETDLGALLADKSAPVRRRAALAAGRIGDERAVFPVAALLRADRDETVRAMAAFALGEIESPSAAPLLLDALRLTKSPAVRARVIEALGKIVAALPEADAERRKTLGDAIMDALSSEGLTGRPNKTFVLLGLTAALRSRHERAPNVVAAFLNHPDARVRADALNTLARLRAKESLEKIRAMLASDADPVVRANAARVLGAAADADAADALSARVVSDSDSRVRVASIRALAQLNLAPPNSARAAAPLLTRAEALLASYSAAKTSADARPPETSELLEIATALGRVLANRADASALSWLRLLREAEGRAAPEVEIAMARIAPTQYLREPPFGTLAGGTPDARPAAPATWQSVSALAQGLAEIASLTSATGGNSFISLQADAQIILRTMLEAPATPAKALPDVMRALAAFKPGDLASVMRARLASEDVLVRSTAADILSESAPAPETTRALAAALPRALTDEMNDAALSILAALAQQKTSEANDAIKTATGVPDHLVRRRAAQLLREAGASGPAPATNGAQVETVATQFRAPDYVRALSRAGRAVRARVSTDKGEFVIELLPEDAPLTVDNFVTLARRGYFNNLSFHRVVPNFVVQGGDPRGDGSGGPGYQIRCEINFVPYERGAVGMALSGKDTGGSQWFVTHSPQPHLDGGYTVFGRVVEGMDVVDRVARGDRIRTVVITEGAQRARPTRAARATR